MSIDYTSWSHDALIRRLLEREACLTEAQAELSLAVLAQEQMEARLAAQAEEIDRLKAEYFDVARTGEEQAAIAIAQASKLAAVRALADEAREWGRGNPEVLFFEQDIRAVLDAEAEEDR